jgi:hypothetical protein
MQNPDYYPVPLEFNGFRFVDQELVRSVGSGFKAIQERPSKLTDVNNSWHVWGTGRMAWYALSLSLSDKLFTRRN